MMARKRHAKTVLVVWLMSWRMGEKTRVKRTVQIMLNQLVEM